MMVIFLNYFVLLWKISYRNQKKGIYGAPLGAETIVSLQVGLHMFYIPSSTTQDCFCQRELWPWNIEPEPAMDWGVPTLDPKRNKQSDYFKSLYGAEDNTLEIDDNSRATPPLSNFFINKGQLDDIPSLFNPIRTSSASTSPNSRRSSRFFSNSSSTSPKMHNIKESPPKRFTKARLNNVENRDYLIESPTSIYRSLPPIPSPTERAITRGMEEMSILDSPTTPQSTTASFFKMPMISPSSSDPQIKKKKSYSADSPTSLNKRSSTIFSMDFDEMPLDMQIICDARTSGYVHDMDVFVNQSYGEFWELSMDEGKCYKQWSKSQFETFSLKMVERNLPAQLTNLLEQSLNISPKHLKICLWRPLNFSPLQSTQRKI